MINDNTRFFIKHNYSKKEIPQIKNYSVTNKPRKILEKTPGKQITNLLSLNKLDRMVLPSNDNSKNKVY